MLMCAGAAASAPAARGIATIVDGEARLIREATTWRLAEGVRLATGDIVQTTAATRLVRLELADGQAVDLGPATQLQLAPQLQPERGRRAPALYLLQGWVKLTAPAAGTNAAQPLLGSAGLDVDAVARDVVLSLQGDTACVFAESGAVTLMLRDDGRATPLELRPGEFFARDGAAEPGVARRPNTAFLQQVPVAFRDTLPLRAERFAAREVAPEKIAAITYADVQPWLSAEPALRRGFVSRWWAAARGREFRHALAANLAAHPEWDRVLNPEKYRPRPAKTAVPGAPPAAWAPRD